MLFLLLATACLLLSSLQPPAVAAGMQEAGAHGSDTASLSEDAQGEEGRTPEPSAREQAPALKRRASVQPTARPQHADVRAHAVAIIESPGAQRAVPRQARIPSRPASARAHPLPALHRGQAPPLA